MKKTIVTGLVLLLLGGCTQPATNTTTNSSTAAANTSTSTAVLKDTGFQHDALPEMVENVDGIVDLSEIGDLSTKNGKTTFVMLSATDPLKGVLIVAKETPDEIQKNPGGKIRVTGHVKSDTAANVTGNTKAGAKLAAKDGKIQYIEADTIIWETPAAGAETTGAAPPPGETPTGTGTPGDMTTPTGTETPAPGAATPGAETPAAGAETPPATPTETPAPQ